MALNWASLAMALCSLTHGGAPGQGAACTQGLVDGAYRDSAPFPSVWDNSEGPSQLHGSPWNWQRPVSTALQPNFSLCQVCFLSSLTGINPKGILPKFS